MGPLEVAPVTDEGLADELAQLINAAYTAGEGDLWRIPVQRASAASVAGRIRGGEMLAARTNGRVIGCATVTPVDATTMEVGLVSALPDAWGSGVGRELVRAAEELARTRGTTSMQLKMLVPSDRAHPQKDRLRAWYERLGYSLAGSLRFEEVSKQDPVNLAMPCEFLVFRKPLA